VAVDVRTSFALAIISLLMFLVAAPASAQQVPQLAPITGEPADVAAVDATRRILVIGDTLSGGLGAGLVRLTEDEQKFDVTFRPNESSGLARTAIYDWASTLPAILEANEYWGVVVMIGSNDRRDIQGQTFKTPPWAGAYKANTEALLDVLKNQGVKTFWAGNPPFADPALNDDIVYITALQKELVEKRGETFVDLYVPLIGADGKYTDTGADDTGSIRKLRSRDGVTFYKQGNNRLAQIVLGAIQARLADDVFEGTATPEALPATPLLGRTGINGEPVIMESKEIAASLKQMAANSSASQIKVPVAATPLTDADRLFTIGEPVTGPKGRFDDFSAEASSNP
jgi:uncharacterized protein